MGRTPLIGGHAQARRARHGGTETHASPGMQRSSPAARRWSNRTTGRSLSAGGARHGAKADALARRSSSLTLGDRPRRACQCHRAGSLLPHRGRRQRPTRVVLRERQLKGRPECCDPATAAARLWRAGHGDAVSSCVGRDSPRERGVCVGLSHPRVLGSTGGEPARARGRAWQGHAQAGPRHSSADRHLARCGDRSGRARSLAGAVATYTSRPERAWGPRDVARTRHARLGDRPLGGEFRTTVEVDPGQAVVATGADKWIRHPSYAGLLLILAGLGLALGNWLSLAACLVLPLPALVRRIQVRKPSSTACWVMPTAPTRSRPRA